MILIRDKYNLFTKRLDHTITVFGKVERLNARYQRDSSEIEATVITYFIKHLTLRHAVRESRPFL